MDSTTAQGTLYVTCNAQAPVKRKPRVYRKIGGIHWLAIGPWRLSVCRTGTRDMEAMGFEICLSVAMIVATVTTVVIAG